MLHLISLAVFVATLVGAVRTDPTYSAFVVVIDRGTQEAIPSVVRLEDHETRTIRGKATFRKVTPGTHTLTILADDLAYPEVHWVMTVPQTETAIFRLERR